MTRSRGVSLVELIVVLFIIGLMMALLLPALHRSRATARAALCWSNLHQLVLAMETYVDARKMLPSPAPDGAVGGWVLAVLPHMEESALADRLAAHPSSMDLATLAARRPTVLSCPDGYQDGDSQLSGVPVSHYSFYADRKYRNSRLPPKYSWNFAEESLESRTPWVVSPERESAQPGTGTGPHDGHFMVAWTSGQR